MTDRNMENWKPTFAAFVALGTVRDLTSDARPAWVFSRNGRSVRWANPAGGAVFGARRFSDMAGRSAPEADPFARQLARVARNLGEGGTLARLRLTSGARAVPLLCRCRPVRTLEGQRGILIIAVDAPKRDMPISKDMAAAFASEVQSAPPSTDDRMEGGADDARPEEAPVPAGAAEAALVRPHEDEPERFSQALLTDDEAPSEIRHDAAEAPQSGLGGADRPASALPFARKPVRFLWQTDADDRFLFVSPGLGQLVGRTSQVVGETWHDVAGRLQLDPHGRIAEALARHDTWSGLTAWWPVQDSEYRIPAELTALPVFGIDQSFQGFRGFGVLKPGDAVTPDGFRDRIGALDFEPSTKSAPDAGGPETVAQAGVEAAGDPAAPPAHDPSPDPRGPDVATGARVAADKDALTGNVVPLRTVKNDVPDFATLAPHEESAFDEIAAALTSDVELPTDDVSADDNSTDKGAPADGGQSDPLETTEPARDAQEVSVGSVESAERQAEEPAADDPVADDPVTEQSRPDGTGGDGLADASSLAGRLAEADARIRELTAILNTATDGVLVIDEDGRIESINASGEALFGIGEADLVGRPMTDLLDSESAQEAIDYLSGLKENGVASVLNEGREVTGRASGGTIALFMTMGRIGSDENGRFCAVLRDLTHWKQAEAELISARRNAETASSHKSDFLARVSHEIRTPLNAIIGFSEVMIEERFGPIENERYREYLRDMRTSGEHVVSLVNDLLDISKIEAGKLDLEFDAVPLNALVRECITLMQPQANRAHVILRSSLSPDVPSVVADPRTLRQIVLNLLSNSVKFTGPGGQVIASTAALKNGEAVLKVRDTGEGMSDEELERALEPFRQLTTASLGGGGTGLGLPLTKALVEANRAEFSIRSAKGEGTIVTVAFPPTRVLSE